MGAGCSGNAAAESAIMIHFMPAYYIHNAKLSVQDTELVKSSWNAIINENTTSSFVDKGLELFYKVFFTRVDEIGSNSLAFSESNDFSRHRMLILLLSMVLRCAKPDQNIVPDVEMFILRYYEHGFRCYELGVVGEVLIHSMEVTLGDECDVATSMAWTKVYSMFLRIAMPLFARHNSGLRKYSTVEIIDSSVDSQQNLQI